MHAGGGQKSRWGWDGGGEGAKKRGGRGTGLVCKMKSIFK